jgi:cell division transport system ATP-binding protein
VVGKPKLLIADEPTGNLDPELALEVMRLFKRFADVGVTVVVATHDLHLIDQVDGRRIVLRDGRVADTGSQGAGVMNGGTEPANSPGAGHATDSGGRAAP